MIVFILKFSACLAIFLAFYKLFLERENMHQFKRFYLLGVLLVSIIIPFITFTTYIESQPILESLNSEVTLSSETAAVSVENQIDYLPIILWSIYGIGALLFGLKFVYNLSQMILKIKRNPKLKNSTFINVLLLDLVSPHTFFSYIFLNKHKYETHQIPEEVLLHEQTHAKQRHSIDILFIELLQVIFWFNPLIHIIKNSIKLNHEFLADKAVLNKGIETSNYQNILLTFSTKDKDIQLANAINYSSIKKRITVMKTQTSNQKIWFRSLVLLPLLALTLYSFSEYKEVVIETEKPSIENNTFNIDLFRTIWVSIHKNGLLHISNLGNISIEDFEKTINTLNTNLTLEEKNEKLYGIIQIDYETELKTITEIKEIMSAYGIQKISIKEGVWNEDNTKNTNRITEEFTKNSPEKIAKFRIDGKILDVIDMPLENLETVTVNGKTFYSLTVNGKTSFMNEKRQPVDNNGNVIKTKKTQDGASREQMKEYERLAKHYNLLPKDQMVIKKEDLERMKYIYGLMSDKQKKETEPFPILPPPPPPPAPKAGETEKVVPPPPPIPENATPEQRKKYEEATRLYKIRTEKLALQEARSEKINAEKAELARVRELTKEEVAKLKKEKEAYKNRQKLEPAQIREVKSAEVEKLKKEKLAYKEAQAVKLKTEKRELAKLKELRKKEDVQKLKQEKLAYAEAQRAKLSDEERLIRVQEIEPPKPPKSSLDHVIDMAKKDAKFYLEGKEITSDEAIKALKEKKHLNIRTLDSSSKQPKVYITKDPITIDDSKKKMGYNTNLPKPTAINALSHLKVMNRHNAKFYLDGEVVSFENALKAVRKNKNADINTTQEPPVVKISTKQIGVLSRS